MNHIFLIDKTIIALYNNIKSNCDKMMTEISVQKSIITFIEMLQKYQHFHQEKFITMIASPTKKYYLSIKVYQSSNPDLLTLHLDSTWERIMKD